MVSFETAGSKFECEKEKRMKTFFFLVFYLHITLAWWPFSKDSDKDEDTANENTPQKDGVLVPFEINSAEQKFLQEAKQLLDLPPLEQCQHKVSRWCSGLVV